MKICRFNDNRLGMVEFDQVYDVSGALDVLPIMRWPFPPGDQLIANLDAIITAAKAIRPTAPHYAIADVTLHSPVANPSKIVAAPVNYQLHIEEGLLDPALHQQREVHMIDKAGPFLKAVSSLVGPGDGVEMYHSAPRHDHEIELAVVIGRPGRNIAVDAALDHVAGYAIGLDMSIRGSWDRSARKSCDSYSVLGPWLVTADEIANPCSLDFTLCVNGEKRQQSSTSNLIYDVAHCIAFCSTFYTLQPGDIIMTGTPEGVGPVKPGDVMVATMEGIGEMTVAVRRGA